MKHQETCPYCNGQGYFQLILGGTANCPNCSGQGSYGRDSGTAAVGNPK